MTLTISDDGLPRCDWGDRPEIYRTYHDLEWGRATTDDKALFEKICLEGFQAGLSWLTILRKRDNFRAAFAGFEPSVVAGFGEQEVTSMLADAGIVRHEGKIRSTMNNARRALTMISDHGSLASFFWGYAPRDDGPPSPGVAMTQDSAALSRDLKRLGWSFVGPTTVYAFMQAMGLVNDHLEGCHVRVECDEERRQALLRVI